MEVTKNERVLMVVSELVRHDEPMLKKKVIDANSTLSLINIMRRNLLNFNNNYERTKQSS